MAEFDPSSANVDEVLKKLEKADDEERQRILNAERAGKARKSILEEYGVDPDQRVDASGRVLYPWEVSPEEQTFAVQVDETAEERKAREAQAEFQEQVEKSGPQVDEQRGGTAAGVGTAAGPATGAAAGGAGAAGGAAGGVAGGPGIAGGTV